MNKRSLDSKSVANRYCQLRYIPRSNIFEIDWPGTDVVTTVDAFRENLLDPILNEIIRRRLLEQIDHIVYSTGFPYAVDFSSDFGANPPDSYTGRHASLTGLTFLHELLRQKDTKYATFNQVTNHYANLNMRQVRSQGFRANNAWVGNGQVSSGSGSHYYLSTMLAYTSGRGNSLHEVDRYLTSAAIADASRPQGTIYFCSNNDVRSTTRAMLPGQKRPIVFEAVAEHLKRKGIRAEVIENATIPQGKSDVMGAVVGTSNFDWLAAKNRIRPGAICEHLTSFGGMLKQGAGQTPLTEFLRHGAAGASGTVYEPYSMQSKFPHPLIQMHYANGCCLAEAFYQSISCPYQLLIVGDPLCRPWASVPVVQVDGIKEYQTLQGKVSVTPTCLPHVPVQQIQFFTDGRLVEKVKPGAKLEIDTTKLTDGYHEFRFVAIEDSPVQSQGRIIVPVRINNLGYQVSCKPVSSRVTRNDRIVLDVNAPDAKEIIVFHRRTLLARMKKPAGQITINPQTIGLGTTELTVIAKKGRGAKNTWFADPVLVTVN